MIILKNINGKVTARGWFRGREIVIHPKHSYILESDEEGIAEANYLKQTFGFVIDITSLYKVEDEKSIIDK
jgi:hypothetical protein